MMYAPHILYKKTEVVKAKQAAIKEWKDKIKAKKEAKHKK